MSNEDSCRDANSIYEDVWTHRGFCIPDEYRIARALGAFAAGPAWLLFTDVEWLPLSKVPSSGAPIMCEPLDLVAFAHTARLDMYGWLAHSHRTEVFFARSQLPEVTKFAPSFHGALYRLFVEEFTASDLLVIEALSIVAFRARMKLQVELASKILPPRWSERLREFLSRPGEMLPDGTYSLVSVEEAQDAISRDLGATLDSLYPGPWERD